MADLKADIEKYLSGKLSPSEMHALEKKALDDPFLAEALEGGSLLSPDEFMSDVKDLQKAINEKTSQRKPTQSTFWIWPMRIAAGLLLLTASTYVVFNLVDKNSKTTPDSIALNKSIEDPQAHSVPRESDSVLSENNLSTSEYVQPSPEEKKEKTERKIAHESEQKPKDAIHAEEKSDDLIIAGKVDEVSEAKTSGEEESIIVSPRQETIAQNEDVSTRGRALEKESSRELRDVAVVAPSGAIAKSKLKIDSKHVKGKVTDIDDGLPLPGVNVLVEGTTVGTVTDLNGNYEISVPENQNNNLVFSYIGMEAKEISMGENDTEVNVQMTPDVSELSEVVVTGYGTGEEPPSMENIKWEITEPEGGKKVYRNYLEQNLRYPEVAIKNNVEGKVTIQFTVEPSGQLTDFRVVKSLGSGCDDEVIRLIKEGPKWRPTKRNDEPVKSKAKVKMRFALPGKKKD